MQCNFCYNSVLPVRIKHDICSVWHSKGVKLMRVTIRDYQDPDFSACCSLWQELAAHHAKIYEDPAIGGDDPGRGFKLYIDNAQRKATWVAEVEGHVRGFILGRVAHAGEAATEVGMIQILGVHPDYQQRGIATQLVNALCEKYRSKGISRVRAGIDQRDKRLLNFFEHVGFSVGHLIDYSKTL